MHFLEDPVRPKYVLTDELSFQVLSEHSGVSFANSFTHVFYTQGSRRFFLRFLLSCCDSFTGLRVKLEKDSGSIVL